VVKGLAQKKGARKMRAQSKEITEPEVMFRALKIETLKRET
jgi:hypothetical protein